MVVEYIRYAAAGQVLRRGSAMPGLRGGRGVEASDHFVVRIDWDSIQAHAQGFRSSAHFGLFLGRAALLLADRGDEEPLGASRWPSGMMGVQPTPGLRVHA